MPLVRDLIGRGEELSESLAVVSIAASKVSLTLEGAASEIEGEFPDVADRLRKEAKYLREEPQEWVVY